MAQDVRVPQWAVTAGISAVFLIFMYGVFHGIDWLIALQFEAGKQGKQIEFAGVAVGLGALVVTAITTVVTLIQNSRLAARVDELDRLKASMQAIIEMSTTPPTKTGR